MQNQNEAKTRGEKGGLLEDLSFLVELNERGKEGDICILVVSKSQSMHSRSGWQYRKLQVKDRSMNAEMLIAEEKYSQWEFEAGDRVICKVKSGGMDNTGKLTVFFDEFLLPFDAARIAFSLASDLYDTRGKESERMKSSETVYQMSAREAKSLLELIKLWITEGKPQHYTSWVQMHQIVATNLYYMGLVNRTAPMSGYYYPTTEALEFFEGKRNIPKKRVFIRDRDGKHKLASDEGDSKSFSEYLSDHADRESALSEYSSALESYRARAKSSAGR